MTNPARAFSRQGLTVAEIANAMAVSLWTKGRP
jgi:hypothetical protein